MGFVHALGSFFIPGLGQALGGDIKKGVIFFFGLLIVSSVGQFFMSMSGTGFKLIGGILFVAGFIGWLGQVLWAYNEY